MGDINVKVELEGEKEFKQGIDNISAGIKVNRSEMKLLEAQYGKNDQSVKGLKAKHEALIKTIASQSEKVKALQYQMNRCVQKYGEADKQTLKVTESYNKARAELADLNSELRKTDASIAKNSGSYSVYVKNHKALSKEIADQTTRVIKLQQALEQAKRKAQENSQTQDQTKQKIKENSQEIKDLTIAYNDAKAALTGFTKEIKANDAALKNAQIEAYQKKLEDFNQKMKSIGNGMKSAGDSMTKYLTAPVVAGFALVTKGTEEFRGDLAKLENNAALAGVGMQKLHDQMGFLNAITGETDSNIEALSNLLQAGFKDNSLAEAVELLSGAVLKFPDTLKIESLADSLQETIATREATGQFAELLGRLGIETDKFTDGLQRAAKQGKETKYVLEQLGKSGLSDATKTFEKNNKALIDSQKAAYEMQVAFAKVGNRLMPIITKITNGITSVVDAFNELDEGTQNFILTAGVAAAAVGPVLSVTGNLVLGIGALSMAFGKGALSATANAAAVTAAGVATAGTGMSAATAAGSVQAFNLSLSACPALMIVGGLLAVGAAIAAIVISAQEANPELRKLGNELKEQRETMDELAEERDEAIQGSIGEAEHLRALKSELESYLDENNKVIDSKSRVKYIVDEINRAMPDSIKWIDSETIAYQKTEKAIDALIAKKRAQIILDAMEPEYENAILNVKKVQNEQAALGVQISKKQAELNKITTEQEGEAGRQRIKQIQDLQVAIEELKKKKTEAAEVAGMFHGNTKSLDDVKEFQRQIDEKKAQLKELQNLQGQQSEQAQRLAKEIQKFTSYQKECENTADEYLRTIRTVEKLDESVATSNTNAINTIVDNYLNANTTIKMSAKDYAEYTKQQYEAAQKNFEKGLISKKELENAKRRFEEAKKQAELQARKSGEDIGKAMSSGIAKGVANGQNEITSALTRSVDNATAKTKEKYGIHSPSRVFADEIGRYLPLGIAAGYKEAMPEALQQMQNSYSRITAAMQSVTTIRPGINSVEKGNHLGALAGDEARGAYIATMNVYPNEKQWNQIVGLLKQSQKARHDQRRQ